VFDLAAACAEAGPSCPGPLVCLGAVLFADHALCDAFGIPEEALLAFLAAAQAAYLPMPYHNALHATDVLHGSNYILAAAGLQATPLEALALLLAAVVHDMSHPGLNGAFLSAANAPLARRYNDTHVLEQYHLHTAFTILARPGCDITACMTADDVRTLRRLLISLVLATDMADHAAFMVDVQRRIAPGAPPPALHAGGAQRELALQLALKCADISNAAKPVASAVRWSVAIAAEAHRRGNAERAAGLPLSAYCDRSRASDSAATMLRFVQHTATPLYAALGALLPRMAPVVARARRNCAYYASQAACQRGDGAPAAAAVEAAPE
jgi:hypothetical protein